MINLIFGFLLISFFNASNDVCNLSGKLDNVEKVAYLYIKDYDSPNLIDSVLVKDGSFHLELKIGYPKLFILEIRVNHYEKFGQKLVWLEPGEVDIKGGFESFSKLSVFGSDSHKEYEQFINIANKYKKGLQNLFGSEINDSIQNLNLRNNFSHEMTDFLLSHTNSFVALWLLSIETDQFGNNFYGKKIFSIDEVKNIYSKFPSNLRESQKGLEIKKYIESPKIGDQAPDFKQITPSGDTISLLNFRGKYLLIDFWASGCAPCRKLNKELKVVYNKYKDNGFEILGVSGDNKYDNWIKSIKQDSIIWTNISDLKGWKNKAFQLYNIKSIPAKFLIDKNGVIIGTNYIDIQALDSELSRIFENKNGL